MMTNFDHLQVRVNVTWPSTILELTETSAVVRVPTAPSTDRQTTVIIKNDNGESLYLPGRIVRSRPEAPGGCPSGAPHRRRVLRIVCGGQGLAAAHHCEQCRERYPQPPRCVNVRRRIAGRGRRAHRGGAERLVGLENMQVTK